MKTISLTQGLSAVVDDDFRLYPNPMAGEVLNYKWHVLRSGPTYAVRNIRLKNGKRTLMLLHRFLMDAPDGVEVDHIDGNGLNNCIRNLRLVSHAQNLRGFQRKSLGCSSKYRGVDWYRAHQKWRAQINYRGRFYHLGYFYSEKDAARAYDVAAKKYFGEFAQSNL